MTYIDALTESATSLYASPQVESLLGYSGDEWLNDPEFFPKLLHPDDRDRILALVAHCNETAEPFVAEYRLIGRDARTIWVQDESLVVQDADGRKLFTQGYLLDITARKESEQRLAAAHGVARAIAEAETIEEAAPRSWRSSARHLAGRAEGCGSTDPRDVAAADYAVPVLSGSETLGVRIHGRGTSEPDEAMAGTLGVIASQLAQFIERKRSEDAVRYQALHDGLTGLPNRTLFHDRVQHTLEQSRRRGESFAVLIMDLDRFKDVNDTLGHHCGDELLGELGRRLHEGVRSSETVARLGGDEFGFLLTGVNRRRDGSPRGSRAGGAVGADRRARAPRRGRGQHRYRLLSGARHQRQRAPPARGRRHVRREADGRQMRRLRRRDGSQLPDLAHHRQ